MAWNDFVNAKLPAWKRILASHSSKFKILAIAIWVVKFPRKGYIRYKLSKIFDQKSRLCSKEIIIFCKEQSAEISKSAKICLENVKNHLNRSDLFFHWNHQFRCKFLSIDIFDSFGFSKHLFPKLMPYFWCVYSQNKIISFEYVDFWRFCKPLLKAWYPKFIKIQDLGTVWIV